MFAPDMSLWTKIAIGIVMTWITVYVNIISLEVGKWVPNAGAAIKALIMVSIGVGGAVYAFHHGVANDMSLASYAPSWQAGLAFLPVIVYNFMGFELMSGASEEMKNPQRDVPRAIIVSGIFIAAFYLLATVGMLIALPVEQIGLIEGLLDSLHKLFDGYAWGAGFVMLLGIGALFSFLANMVTWTIGANRSASEAAARADLPEVFGRLHPLHRTPANAAIIAGLVSTVVIVLYGLLASSAEDLFWTLFAFSSIVFLLPYVLMFAAFLKLRGADAAHPRPYRVPGGAGFARVLVGLCILFIAQALVLFVWVPGDEFDPRKALAIVGGVIATVIVGEILIRHTRRPARAVLPHRDELPSM
jgi:amino acid transporter